MRRSLLASATAVALGVGVLAAAPAATAATDPIGVSLTASPAATTIQPGSPTAVALTAVFDDLADNVRAVDFEILRPDGTKGYAYASGYLSKAGVRETFRATHNVYNFYAPGVYRVIATAQRDYTSSEPFAGTPQVTGSFTVKHKISSTIYATKSFFKRGEKIRFKGKIGNTTDGAGLKVTLRFKAKGTKKFKKVGKAVRTNAAGEWTSKKVRMNKNGKWFAKIGSKGYVVGSKTSTLKARFRKL